MYNRPYIENETAIPTIIKIYILGNAQGKYQRHPHVDGNKDYLQAALWDGSPVEITIPPASDGKDFYKSYRSFSSLVLPSVVC